MSITVKTQMELDKIPLETKEQIYIDFGTSGKPALVKNKYFYKVIVCENSSVEAYNNSSIVVKDHSSVVAYENSCVNAYGDSHIVAFDNSFVELRDSSSATGYNNSSIITHNSSIVEAFNNSSIIAFDNSSVIAHDNSLVKAYDNSYIHISESSSVIAYHNTSIAASDNSSVVAWGTSLIIAYNRSSVVAYDNSCVEAFDNSFVKAKDNSCVIARENSSIKAIGNAQVVDKLLSEGSIQLSGNARKTCTPKNIEEFMNFYDIKHNKKAAIFYKAVHKKSNEYISDYDINFKYEIGKSITEPECSINTNDLCAKGIHISHLDLALSFGKSWKDLAILELEVEIKDIVMPSDSNGKVRTSKAKVIREVPLSECGVYGKILARKQDK